MRKALRDVFGFLRDYHEMATLILLQLLALGILLHLDNAGGNVALFCAFLLIVQSHSWMSWTTASPKTPIPS